MDDVVIIAAAGWKGTGREIGLAECPAPFLPLGDGTSALSRLSKQFYRLDYNVFIAVGALGYPFKAYQPRGGYRTQAYADRSIDSILEEIGVQPNDSPWMPERHAYAATLGEIVIMPDPGWSNQHDSFCEAMDYLGDNWERLVLICGDTIFSTTFLIDVFKTLPWPCQFGMHYNHAIFLLDKVGGATYRSYTEGHRKRARNLAGWPTATKLYPDGGIGTGRLGILGVEHCGWHSRKWRHLRDWRHLWFDIDHPNGYQEAMEGIKKGMWR